MKTTRFINRARYHGQDSKSKWTTEERIDWWPRVVLISVVIVVIAFLFVNLINLFSSKKKDSLSLAGRVAEEQSFSTSTTDCWLETVSVSSFSDGTTMVSFIVYPEFPFGRGIQVTESGKLFSDVFYPLEPGQYFMIVQSNGGPFAAISGSNIHGGWIYP